MSLLENNHKYIKDSSIRPVSPSYATRLGIAEALDYLANKDFHCINYLLVAATRS
jgi:hypothetical protein